MRKILLQMFAGYRGKSLAYLLLSASASPTTELEGTKGDLAFNITNAEVDITDDDSDGNYEFIPGDKSATITGSFNYKKQADTSVAQLALIAASYDQSLVYLEWAYETTATTGIDYAATGYVTDCSSTNGDPETISFTIKITGAITAGTQSA